ncbi:MAG: hypothetical protein HKM04_06815 [Legionellales bacterium]|nr:hypothetical protein [Legionellales bacterium]
MESQSSKQQYRPLFTLLRIGSKEYPVLDQSVALRQAETCLTRALFLMQSADADRHAKVINHELLLACDLGSSDAAFLLASRVLDNNLAMSFPQEDAVVFLKIAADRRHPEAAYQLGSCYAGIDKTNATEVICSYYFDSISGEERSRLAEHYFEFAVAAEHREAIEELIIAYAYGRGYINKDAAKFSLLCQRLIERGDQAVTLGYGAWLAGMTVEGEKPLAEAVSLPVDYIQAIGYLILASKGSDMVLGQHALHLICLGLAKGLWDSCPPDYLAFQLKQSVDAGNQLLALYFAWYAIPMHRRCEMPELLEQQQLTLLASFVEQGESSAMYYLDKALVGSNMPLSSIAKELLLQVFSYGSDEMEGQLVN